MTRGDRSKILKIFDFVRIFRMGRMKNIYILITLSKENEFRLTCNEIRFLLKKTVKTLQSIKFKFLNDFLKTQLLIGQLYIQLHPFFDLVLLKVK